MGRSRACLPGEAELMGRILLRMMMIMIVQERRKSE